MNQEEAKKIIQQFKLEGMLQCCEPFGEGHINHSYRFTMLDNEIEKNYILQRVNTNIFLEPKVLMENIFYVTNYLKEDIKKQGGDPERETLTIIKTKNDELGYEREDGYYRVYLFIENAICYQVATPELFYRSAKAFGKFVKQLAEFDTSLLVDSIPNFHHTPKRYNDFIASVERDAVGRVAEAKEEIEFLKARKDFASIVVDEIEKGTIPIRVCHNDTKLNNVMMDEQTQEGLCVIDLDTVMQGSLLYDFGDSIRYGATTVIEDEEKLDLVSCDLEKFALYVKGYFEECKSVMNEKEIELIPYAGMLITFENAMRFLADYFDGDTYYKVHKENHNLIRARNQIKLVKDMEEKIDELIRITQKYS